MMRENNAIYGGEMSAHHYFKDFAYCDSGLIPFLIVAEIVAKSSNSLSELIDEMRRVSSSGEINISLMIMKKA